MIRLKKRKLQKWLLFCIGMILLTSLALYLNYLAVEDITHQFRDDFQKITYGMKETQVIGIIGKPKAIYASGTKPSVYGEKGYYIPNVTNSHGKTFVYIYGDAVCYIFFNKENRVSRVEIGGS